MGIKNKLPRILIFILSFIAMNEVAFGESFVFQKVVNDATVQSELHVPKKNVYETPGGIAVCKMTFSDPDALPHLFVTDQTYSRIVYDVATKLFGTYAYSWKSFGVWGKGDGQFNSPQGIAAYKDGSLYVSDTKNNRIVKLHFDGTNVVFVKNIGSQGDAPGQFNSPKQISVNGAGNVYIADALNYRIQILNPNGNFIKSFGGIGNTVGKFLAPEGVTVDNQGNIYVCDTGNNRLQKFDPNGNFIKAVSDSDLGVGSSLFTSVDTDIYGRVYVVDRRNHRILKLDSNLSLIVDFGCYGAGNDQFIEPRGIAIYKDNGAVLLTEAPGGQYYDIGTDILNLNITPAFSPYAEENTAQIDFKLTENAYTYVDILDAQGRTVKTLLAGSARNMGRQVLLWDGTDSLGNKVGEGTYTVKIKARCTYSSQNTVEKSGTVAVINPPTIASASFSPSLLTSGTNTNLSYQLSKNGKVTIGIYNSGSVFDDSTLIKSLIASQSRSAGLNSEAWNGYDELGRAPPDGTYTAVIKAADPATGFFGPGKRAQVKIDNTAPVVNLSAPLANAYLNKVIQIKGTASDLNFAEYKIEIGAGPSPSSWTTIKTSQAPVEGFLLAEWDTAGLNGKYTVRLTAKDSVNHASEARVLINVDNTPPEASNFGLTNPFFSPNGDTQKDNTVLSYRLAEDSYVGVKVVKVIDASRESYAVVRDLQKEALQIAGTYNITWEGKDDLGNVVSDTNYHFLIEMRDYAGNTGKTALEGASLEVTVDNSAPRISILEPQAQSFYGQNVLLTAAVADLFPDIYSLQSGSGEALSDWRSLTPDLKIPPGGNLSYNWETKALNGVYKLRVKAQDLAGNVSSREVTINLDNTPPSITNLNLANDPFSPNGDFRKDEAIISYLVSDNFNCDIPYSRLEVYNPNNQLVRRIENYKTRPLGQLTDYWDGKDDGSRVVRDGEYRLKIVVQDKTGNLSEAVSAVVRVDAVPPTLNTLSVDNVFSPNSDGIKDTASVAYNLGEPATVSEKIVGETELYNWAAAGFGKYYPEQPFSYKVTANGERPQAFNWTLNASADEVWYTNHSVHVEADGSEDEQIANVWYYQDGLYRWDYVYGRRNRVGFDVNYGQVCSWDLSGNFVYWEYGPHIYVYPIMSVYTIGDWGLTNEYMHGWVNLPSHSASGTFNAVGGNTYYADAYSFWAKDLINGNMIWTKSSANVYYKKRNTALRSGQISGTGKLYQGETYSRYFDLSSDLRQVAGSIFENPSSAALSDNPAVNVSKTGDLSGNLTATANFNAPWTASNSLSGTANGHPNGNGRFETALPNFSVPADAISVKYTLADNSNPNVNLYFSDTGTPTTANPNAKIVAVTSVNANWSGREFVSRDNVASFGTNSINIYNTYSNPDPKHIAITTWEIAAIKPDGSSHPDIEISNLRDIDHDNYPETFDVRLKESAEIKTILVNAAQGVGNYSSAWAGRNNFDQRVPDATYTHKTIALDAAENESVLSNSLTVDTTPPQAAITSPANNQSISGQISIQGKVKDAYFKEYELLYGPGEVPVSWSSIGGISPSQKDGTLGLWDTTDLNGKYTLKLRAEDEVGNRVEKLTAVWLDNPAPLLKVENPLNNYISPNGDRLNDKIGFKFLLYQPARITLSVYDSQNRIIGKLFDNQLFDRNTAEGYAIDWQGRDAQGQTVPEGEYRFDWQAVVPVTLFSQARTGYVNVDITPPAVSLASPSAESTVEGLVQVSGSVNDNNLVKYLIEYAAGKNPAEWLALKETNSAGAAGPLFAWNTEGLSGIYSLRVRALDSAGNAGTNAVSFNLANAPPQINIISPLENALVGGKINLIGELSDLNLKGYLVEIGEGASPANWQKIKEGLNLPAQTVNGILAAWDTTAFKDGIYIIRLTADDSYANKANYLLHVTVDNTPPEAWLNRPANLETIGGQVRIYGGAREANFAKYMVDCKEYFSPQWTEIFSNSAPKADELLGEWNTQTAPKDGRYYLRLRAWDKVSNCAEKTIQVNLDNTPPLIRIKSPAQNSFVQGAVNISFDLTDDHPKSFKLSYENQSQLGVWKTILERPEGASNETYSVNWDTAGINGAYIIRLESEDTLGNRAQADLTLTLDNIPPVITAVSDAPDPFSPNGDGREDTCAIAYALSEEAYITITIFDNQNAAVKKLFDNVVQPAGVQSAVWDGRGSNNLDGVYTYQIEAKDQAGNLAQPVSGTIEISFDKTPPITSLSIGSPKYGVSPLYATSACQFTLSATDDVSGVNYTEYKIDNGNWQKYAGAFTLVAQGPHNLYYRSVDKSNNLENANSIALIIDDASPVTGFLVGEPQANGRITSNTSITLIASDELAGVNYIEYRLDGGQWNNYLNPFKLIGLEDGLHKIEFRAIDNLFNTEEVKTLLLGLDNSPPATSYSILGPKYGALPTYVTINSYVQFTAEDNLAGVSRIEISLDNEPFRTYRLPINFASEGMHTISYRAVDNVTNIETPHVLNLIVDNTSPETVILPAFPQYDYGDGRPLIITSHTPITLEAADKPSLPSGVQFTKYRLDQDGWLNYAKAFYLSETDGPHTIEAYSADNLGNTEAVKRLSVIVDNTPPTAEISIPSNENTGVCKILNGLVQIIGTTNDIHFNWYKIEYKKEGADAWNLIQAKTYNQISSEVLAAWDTTNLAAGWYYIKITAQDKVGNEAQSQVKIYVGQPELKQKFGGNGKAAGQFNHPSYVALDAAGNIYVTDTNNDRVQKFDPVGRFLLQIGPETGLTKPEKGKGKVIADCFNQPTGIAVDEAGFIYVADRNNDRVLKFNPAGEFVKQIGEGKFNKPHGLTLNGDGNLLIADRNNDCIQVFDREGNYLSTISSGIGEGDLNKPQGAIALDAQGKLYISDRNNDRVLVLDTDGNTLLQIGSAEVNKPDGIWVNKLGYIFVADSNNDRLKKFDPRGNLVMTFGDFNKPSGITLDDLGNLYVVDTNNAEVKKFGLPSSPEAVVLSVKSNSAPLELINVISYPNPFNSTATFKFTFNRAPVANVEVNLRIFTLDGKLVRNFATYTYTGGLASFDLPTTWAATNDLGEMVNNGAYIYLAEVKAESQTFKKTKLLSVLK